MSRLAFGGLVLTGVGPLNNDNLHRFELNCLSRRWIILLVLSYLTEYLAQRRVTRLAMFLEIRPESGFLNVGAMGEFSLQEAERTFGCKGLKYYTRLRKYSSMVGDLLGAPVMMERLHDGESRPIRSLSSEKAPGVNPATKLAYVLKKPSA